MYSAALEALIFVGNIRVLLIALMILFGLGSIAVWLLRGFSETRNKVILTIRTILCWVVPILFISVCAIYNLPVLKEEIVVARAVTPILDKYVEENPDSIYNPDIILGVTNDAVVGIATFAGDLPNYLSKLASGGIPALLTTKSLDNMTPEEIRKLSDEEFNRLNRGR